MKLESAEKIAIFGAGSGLGLELAKELQKNPEASLALWSRKLSSEVDSTKTQFFKADFSLSDSWSQILSQVQEWSPTRLIYCAGGGPYGRFEEKNWASHEWTYRVNFLFPSFLIHGLLQRSSSLLPDKSSIATKELKSSPLKQALFIGSSIAENAVDPMAASYSASKHALKGMILNLINENSHLDIRLFSPGYMKTKMLPPQSEPVLKALAREPSQVAIEIIDWMLTPKAMTQAHIVSR